jgi:hypothetical protein
MLKERHNEHSTTLSVIFYFEQHMMLTRVNGTVSVLSMFSSARYSSILEFVKFSIILVMVSTSTCIYRVLLLVAVLYT